MRYFTRELMDDMQVRGKFPNRTGNKEKWLSEWNEFYNLCHVGDYGFNSWVFEKFPEIKDEGWILERNRFVEVRIFRC